MNDKVTNEPIVAIQALLDEKIVLYPAEAVYGVGCKITSTKSIAAIREIKQREQDLGLIIVAADWQSVQHLVEGQDGLKNNPRIINWPDNVTYVFTASEIAPDALCAHGREKTIAIRVSQSQTIQKLCKSAGPIVSTSANFKAQKPPTKFSDIPQSFLDKVDLALVNDDFSHNFPSEIINFYTEERFRVF